MGISDKLVSTKNKHLHAQKRDFKNYRKTQPDDQETPKNKPVTHWASSQTNLFDQKHTFPCPETRFQKLP